MFMDDHPLEKLIQSHQTRLSYQLSLNQRRLSGKPLCHDEGCFASATPPPQWMDGVI